MHNHRTFRLVTPPSPSVLRGSLVGTAVLAGLTAAKLLFDESIGRPTPFLTYFGAVLVAAWYGGLVAGAVTTALSAALGYACFIAGNPDVASARAAVQVAVFGVEGLSIAWLTGRLAHERRSALAHAATARESADKLEAVLQGLEDGITLQDESGAIVYANAAAARIVGVASPADLVADPAAIVGRFEMFDETGAPLSPERLPSRQLRAGGTAGELLVQFRERGGSTLRWSMVGATGVRDEQGELRFVVNVFRDVTERHRQEEALRISQEWFSTALRSIGDAVIATDASGAITFVNPVAEALTGWSASECAARPLAEVFAIVDEDTRRPTASPVERVLREGIVVGLANHTLLLRKDGSEIAIDDSAAPIRGPDGKLVGVVLVFRDVTEERRRHQRAAVLARASEELTTSLDYEATLAKVARLAVPHIADWCAVDIVEDGEVRRLAVAHVDPAKIEAVREIDRRWPPDPHAATGVPNILRTGQPEMVAEIPASVIEAAARDEEHLRSIRALQLRSYIGVPLARSGATFGVLTLVMAESGRTYGAADRELALALAERAAVAVENARLYRAAQSARAEAELANRTKDDFLAMLGHELRNPLAPILTALELIKLRAPPGIEREREIMERQVRSVVRLVDDLLDVSRITRGRIELDRAPVELADVVAKGIEVASTLVEARRHSIEVDVPRGLVVDGDAMRLAQVFANLVINAAKYTEPGGRIRIVGERDGSTHRVRVCDSGMGIAPDMLARIFGVFVQGPQAIDRGQGGLGLGLTIVQSLVRLHGGSIAAHSDGPGQGSEFVVTLPGADPSAAASAATESATEAASRALSILVVDDNADALEMLVEALTLLGHRPVAAPDGPTALEVAATHQPSIALLDLGLPGLDGYGLAQRLRELPGLGGLRLVAITGYGQASDRARTAAAGFAAHLVKPAGLETIRSILEELSD